MVSGYNHCDIYVDSSYGESLNVNITNKFNSDIFKNDKPLKTKIIFNDGNILVCTMSKVKSNDGSQIFSCCTGVGNAIFNINIATYAPLYKTVDLVISSGLLEG